jgi:2-polyprenyl-6-methoxyphenol hydroxylase-like FAD-dependent oxidoreductase
MIVHPSFGSIRLISMEKQPHVLIIGAGMTGVLLAQALKTRDIAFSIYERDPNANFRGPGWGLAIHWAKDTLLSLLPQTLQDRLLEANVDPEGALKGECGRFPLFDLGSGERLFENVSENRIRVSRERLRELLMTGLTVNVSGSLHTIRRTDVLILVQWNKRLEKIVQNSEHGITVTFSDGTTAEGTHVVGCDGTRSKAREILCSLAGKDSHNDQLDVRFLGCSVELPTDVVLRIRQLDPLFFQGHHRNGSFFFFGIQETPPINERGNYRCQVNVSWQYCKGFLGRDHPPEVPETQEARLALIREIASHWTSPFQDVVHSIPPGIPLQEIKLEDWLPSDSGAWDNMHGRATLIGDAAHAMTMYRGEAVNHGITDVQDLVECYLHTLSDPEEMLDCQEVCDAFEEKMLSRTKIAIRASRQACLDAHYEEMIGEMSPLVSKRAILA